MKINSLNANYAFSPPQQLEEGSYEQRMRMGYDQCQYQEANVMLERQCDALSAICEDEDEHLEHEPLGIVTTIIETHQVEKQTPG